MSLFTKKIQEGEQDKEEVAGGELGSVMTIEIEKKKKNEKFSVFDLEMFHRECEQGPIKFKKDDVSGRAYTLFFECQRCHMQTCIANTDDIEKTLLAITLVALSGKTFNITDTFKGKKILFLQKK